MPNSNDIHIKINADGSAAINGFKRVSTSMTDLESRASGMASKINASWVNMASGLYTLEKGMQVVSKVYDALIGKTVEAGTEFSRTSQAIGMSVEYLSGLKYAAEQSDVAYESLVVGVKQFSRSLAENDIELKRLGVTSKDSHEALLQVADAFYKLQDSSDKTATAMELFGRSGADLIPLLNSGATGIEKLEAEAHRLNVTFSTESAQAAKLYGDNITLLRANLEGLRNTVANSVVPALNEMIFALREGSLRQQIHNIEQMLPDTVEGKLERWMWGKGKSKEHLQKDLSDLHLQLQDLIESRSTPIPVKGILGNTDLAKSKAEGIGNTLNILPGAPGSEAYAEWEALQMAEAANREYYANKELMRLADRDAEISLIDEILSFREEAAIRAADIEKQQATVQMNLRYQVAEQAAALLVGLIGNQKAAAAAGIAIQTGLEMARSWQATVTASQLAYASQLIPGDPTSIARAVAAKVATLAQGKGALALIAAAGALRLGASFAGSTGGGGASGGGYYSGGTGTTTSPMITRDEEPKQMSRKIEINFNGNVYGDMSVLAREIIPHLNEANGDKLYINNRLYN